MFYDTLIWRVPLDDDLQKPGLASRSEFANLQAGGRGFESHHLHHQPARSAPTTSTAAWTPWRRAPDSCHYRATSLLGGTLRRQGGGGLDELVQSSGDGLIPTGHGHRARGDPFPQAGDRRPPWR